MGPVELGKALHAALYCRKVHFFTKKLIIFCWIFGSTNLKNKFNGEFVIFIGVANFLLIPEE